MSDKQTFHDSLKNMRYQVTIQIFQIANFSELAIWNKIFKNHLYHLLGTRYTGIRSGRPLLDVLFSSKSATSIMSRFALSATS